MKNFKNLVIIAIVAVILLFIGGCKGKNTNSANFGAYPADYGIAYFNMLGVSSVPTVRELFGSDAKFATSFQGIPSFVELESAKGTKNEFTAQLLVTVQDPDMGDTKALRMLATFEADDMAEASYLRYLKIVNVPSGRTTEKSSTGDPHSDANILGVFVGVMENFWDLDLQ